MAACVGLVGCALLAGRRGRVRAVAVGSVALAAGALAASAQPSPRVSPPAGDCTVVGWIVEHAGALGTLAVLESVSCPTSKPVPDVVVIMDGVVGDAGGQITGTGTLMPLASDSFARARSRLGAEAEFLPADFDVDTPRPVLLALAARIRSGSRRASSGLHHEAGALLRGLTIGDTSDMSWTVEERFRRAGLSHLVAVSGSNVAIVLGAVALGTRRLGLHLRIAAGAFALCTFVLVVGPEPSVLRAALMGGIGLVAIAVGRRAEPLHALGLAVGALAIARPSLLTAAGFHLSVAATAGIVLWTDPVAQRLRMPDVVARPLGATLAAQIAVAPVLLASFGELSLIAPLANVLAVPAVAPATVLGYAAALTGAVDASLGAIFARIAEPFLTWVLFVAQIGDASGAAVTWPRWLGLLAAVPVVTAAALTLRSVAAAQ